VFHTLFRSWCRIRYGSRVSDLLVGYARCSTDRQDVHAQRSQLAALGVEARRVYVDEGLSGANRARPGLREAFAACRGGDTLVVTKLDRFARSTADAHDLLDELSRMQVKFAMGGSVYDWADPFGRIFLQILSVVAEFELNLVRMRTREGMAVAKAKGKLRGKQPKLPASATHHRRALRHRRGQPRRPRRRVLRLPNHDPSRLAPLAAHAHHLDVIAVTPTAGPGLTPRRSGSCTDPRHRPARGARRE